MPWALVRRTNLLSVATKLDVPVFHAKRVELGCTPHVHVNSSCVQGFLLVLPVSSCAKYTQVGVSENNTAPCLARKLVLVTRDQHLWHWRDTVKVTAAAM